MNQTTKVLLIILVALAVGVVLVGVYLPRQPQTTASPTPSKIGNVPKEMIDAMKVRTTPIVSRQTVAVSTLPTDVKQLIHSGNSYLQVEKTLYQDGRSGYFILYILEQSDFKHFPDQWQAEVIKAKTWLPWNIAWSPGFAYFEVLHDGRQARVSFYPKGTKQIAVMVEAVDTKK